MLTEFVNYVDSFYGVNDPLYPMMSRETKQPLNKLTFFVQQKTTYQCVVMTVMNYAHGVMAILLIVRESETFYLMITITNMWLHTSRRTKC